MVSPEFELNRREFQQMSQRVIHAFNPKREFIPDAAELRRRIMKGMRETGKRRAWGFVRGGGPEIAVKRANEGERAFQILLGWIKPVKRRIRKVRPSVSKWLTRGYKHLIGEYEWSIIRVRHKLRETGLKLKPYSATRIRRLEEQFLEEIGWKEESNSSSEEKKKYWWQK